MLHEVKNLVKSNFFISLVKNIFAFNLKTSKYTIFERPPPLEITFGMTL